MNQLISVIIPNFNGGITLEKCLDSIFASNYSLFEVIVVDDASEDDSVRIITSYPCRFIQHTSRRGAAAARNTGANQAQGNILFFTDADCVMQPDTLTRLAAVMRTTDHNTLVGGTYAPFADDPGFFSDFQAVFINYFETKKGEFPDYVATHAMAMWSDLFFRHHGFDNRHLPILEDVDYSHRLKQKGVNLKMDTSILVQHNFNFSVFTSLKNAVRKSRYWIRYSLYKQDLLNDSGTASYELKLNAVIFLTNLLLVIQLLAHPTFSVLLLLFTFITTNIYINRSFLQAMRQTHGLVFSVCGSAYYFLLYPLGIWLGSTKGLLDYIFSRTVSPSVNAGRY